MKEQAPIVVPIAEALPKAPVAEQLPIPIHRARQMHRVPILFDSHLPATERPVAEKPRRRRRGSTGRRYRATIDQIHAKHGVIKLEDDPLKDHRRLPQRARIYPKRSL